MSITHLPVTPEGNKNLPAYPYIYKEDNTQYVYPGVSKRELFAALLLQGILANRSVGLYAYGELAKAAILQADMLLKELGT